MVKVYGVNAQDPATDAHTPGQTRSKEREVEEKKGRIFLQSQRGESNPQPSPYKAWLHSYSNIYTAQRSLASVTL